MSDPVIVIMGAPGAGKGTQSDRIVEEFGVEHVTTGDALRANRDMETDYGTPREYMEAGELVPDEVVNEIVTEAVRTADGFVLDGYPRTLAQAEHLDGIADLDVVLYLEVDDELLTRRLSGRRICEQCGANYHVEFDPPAEDGVCDECGGAVIRRDDDAPEVVQTRVREYNEKTAPVVDHYESEGLLVRVDGEGTPEEVWSSVRDAIESAVENQTEREY
jgi:adenylate kinase